MIPIILGATAVGTSFTGICAGIDGKEKINLAQKIVENSQKEYELTQKNLKVDFEDVNRLAEIYGQLQIRVKLNTIKRFISILEILEQNSSQDLKYLKGIGISELKIKELKTSVIEAENLVNYNTLTAAASGVGVAYSAAQAFGAVATRVTVSRFFGLWTTEVVKKVAISELAGAAAWRGMMIWLGGGSIAMGSFIFGGITLAPSIAIGSFQLASKGEKALTQACEYEFKIAREINKIEACQEFLAGVYKRIKELGKLVHRLESSANNLLDKIEPDSYLYPGEIYLKKHSQELHQLTLLTKAVADIINTPILNQDGSKLTTDSFTVYEKYSTLS